MLILKSNIPLDLKVKINPGYMNSFFLISNAINYNLIRRDCIYLAAKLVLYKSFLLVYTMPSQFIIMLTGLNQHFPSHSPSSLDKFTYCSCSKKAIVNTFRLL